MSGSGDQNGAKNRDATRRASVANARRKKPDSWAELIDPRLQPFLDAVAEVLAEDYEKHLSSPSN